MALHTLPWINSCARSCASRSTMGTFSQELAYPMILNKKDVMVASHTGSGKTLAYLLPIAQVLFLTLQLCSL